MLKDIQWFNIAVRMRDFLKSYRYDDGTRLFDYLTNRDDLKIRIGKGNAGEFPAIWILFGDESQIEKQDKIVGGTIQFWVDIYVSGELTSDIDYDDCLYRQIYKIEEELTTSFRELVKIMLNDFGLSTNFKISSILSDGDENAPASVQHRIVLDIEWRK